MSLEKSKTMLIENKGNCYGKGIACTDCILMNQCNLDEQLSSKQKFELINKLEVSK